MKWVDVAGAPGVGKSTLCDPLWGPHDIPIQDVPPPGEWHDFCNEVTRLLGLVKAHPSFVAAVRMNRRSIRKMAAVSNCHDFHGPWPGGADVECQSLNSTAKPYIQTGFVQRGLGFGWRLAELDKPVSELEHFFRLMPVSIGVAFLDADVETVMERNKQREHVRETAHENRSHMVHGIYDTMRYAREWLNARGVPTVTIRTDQPIEDARRELLDFASGEACNAPSHGYSRQIPVHSPPAWW